MITPSGANGCTRLVSTYNSETDELYFRGRWISTEDELDVPAHKVINKIQSLSVSEMEENAPYGNWQNKIWIENMGT